MSEYLECGHPKSCECEQPTDGVFDLLMETVLVSHEFSKKYCTACERDGWVYVSEGLPPEKAGYLDVAHLCTHTGEPTYSKGTHQPERLDDLRWRDIFNELLGGAYAWRYRDNPPSLPENQ